MDNNINEENSKTIVDKLFNSSDRNELFENSFLDFSAKHIKAKTPAHVPTGFEKFDELLGGGLAPGLTVLGAISSLGKSTFSLQLAQNIAKQGRKVIYYSLEMPRHAIAAKAVQRSAFKICRENFENVYEKIEDERVFSHTIYKRIKKKSLSLSDILNEELEKENPEKYKLRNLAEKECFEDCGRNLIVLERDLVNDSFSAEDITGDVEWFIDKTGEKPVVFVDYLQILVSSTEKNLQDKQIVDENIQKLWLIANENNIPVFVISSVNRDSYNKPISFSAFKESGSIEFTADIVLGMQLSAISDGVKGVNFDEEKGKDPRRVEMVVLKQRYGKSGSSARDRFVYYPEFSYFEEVDIKVPDETENPEPETKSKKTSTRTDNAIENSITVKKHRLEGKTV